MQSFRPLEIRLALLDRVGVILGAVELGFCEPWALTPYFVLPTRNFNVVK